MAVSTLLLQVSDFSGDLTDGRRLTERLINIKRCETPTCQVLCPDQHQHAAQDVEAQRRAAEDAALTLEKRRKVAAFPQALIFNHTGNTLDLNHFAAG